MDNIDTDPVWLVHVTGPAPAGPGTDFIDAAVQNPIIASVEHSPDDDNRMSVHFRALGLNIDTGIQRARDTAFKLWKKWMGDPPIDELSMNSLTVLGAYRVHRNLAFGDILDPPAVSIDESAVTGTMDRSVPYVDRVAPAATRMLRATQALKGRELDRVDIYDEMDLGRVIGHLWYAVAAATRDLDRPMGTLGTMPGFQAAWREEVKNLDPHPRYDVLSYMHHLLYSAVQVVQEDAATQMGKEAADVIDLVLTEKSLLHMGDFFDELLTRRWSRSRKQSTVYTPLLNGPISKDTVTTTPDLPKTVREALCLAQSGLADRFYGGIDSDRCKAAIDQIQTLITAIDEHRPTSADGTHGALHTRTCGCVGHIRPWTIRLRPVVATPPELGYS